ncbi:MAG: type III pantothenate kinase [Clostridiales bacterium]|jgi:type III pantothenate kinase|nr:type III pantothenate kinase [Clostridiales bacterium]HOB64858.1 type III pantothenate kinase [Clostridia bacterium]HOK81945.1 type III pantothenate kinase [Clostridia bacterium]HOL61241.1 type III pantothenate kinase [Clostridia bacterium]HPO53919.1 type III pantothenate kinase [Clostridia bacterium]
MVLLLDVGNTNIKIGVVIDDKIVRTWRIATDHNKTADEYGMIFLELLSSIGYNFDQVEGIIISSVAPAINYTIEHMCSYYTKRKPIMVGSGIKMNIKIDYTVPEELGADRIVNAAAAYSIYGGPCITVDFGSATTFGIIDENGHFMGGAIAPGIKSSAEALTNTAAKLPRIELIRPKSIIGKTTVENMQAGVIYGFSGLVEGIIRDMIDESGFKDVKVIATGGMSQLLTSGGEKYFNVIDRALSLKGLKILYDMNKGDHL